MQIVTLGDSSVLIQLGSHADAATLARVHALTQLLRATQLQGVTDIIPSYTTIGVHYDLLVFSEADPEQRVRTWLEQQASKVTQRKLSGQSHVIPVCYEPPYALDLDEVARLTELTQAEVISLHTEPLYTVSAVGFLPGFPYLSGLPAKLNLPRRSTPRTSISPGSVAIAAGQAGIYPLNSPGGWHVLGRTPVRLFTPEADPPTLLSPGDTLRFQPISARKFEQLVKAGVR